MATPSSSSHPTRSGVRRRRREARSDSARFEKVYELVARLAACNDLNSALREVLDASIDVVGADAGYIRLFDFDEADPMASRFPFVVHSGISQEYLEYFANLSQPVNREARQTVFNGHRVIVEDMFTHSAYEAHRETVVAEGYRTQQSTPMMSRNGSKCVGAINTYFRNIQTPPFRGLETLDLYAELAASAIDNHRRVAGLVEQDRFRAAFAGQQADVLRWAHERLSELDWTVARLKPQEVADHARAIASRIEQFESVAPGAADGLADDQHFDNAYGLSPGELEVLVNVWRGLSDKESAAEMGISRFTVAKYLGAAMRKLNVEDRIQAGILVGRDIMSSNDALSRPFSDLLRQFRRRAGLTQSELAEKAGLSHRTISDLERGVRTKVYASTVGLISDALDLPEDDAKALAASVDRSRRPRLDGQHLDHTSLK